METQREQQQKNVEANKKLCVFGPSVQTNVNPLQPLRLCGHGLFTLFNGKFRTQKQFNGEKSYGLNTGTCIK